MSVISPSIESNGMDSNVLITKYAILTRRTELLVHVSADVPSDNANSQGSLFAAVGTFIKVFQTQSASDAGIGKLSTVQVLDFVRHDPIYENLYECPQANLCKVPESLWPFVISIKDPDRRLLLLQNHKLNRWIAYLKENSLVSVCGDLFGNNTPRFCIVRYIGPVEELHPVGYFFGLELLDRNCGYSPQKDDISFAIKYMSCEPSLSMFTTADWISPLPVDVKKKFSAYDFISGTLEKVRTVIGPTSFTSGACTGGSAANRKVKWGGPKKKGATATARFYDSTAVAANVEEIEINSGNDTNYVYQTPPGPLECKFQGANTDTQTEIVVGSEEFTMSIENYEKNMDRKHAGGAAADTYISSSSQSPAGILKNLRTVSGGIGKDTSNAAKPLTIMSLEDRDIVVIDKTDIRESTKNEGSVIVVDKMRPEDLELADLLRGNWPQTAGDAVMILSKVHKPMSQEQNSSGTPVPVTNMSVANRDSSVSSFRPVRSDRNKSPNLLSHLNTSRLTDHGQTISQRPTGDNMKIATGTSDSTVPGPCAGETTGVRVLSHFAMESPRASTKSPSDSSIYGNIPLTVLELFVKPSTRTIDFVASRSDAFSAGELPLLAALEQDFVGHGSPLVRVPNTDLDVGSMVEVSVAETPGHFHGVIRWIGQPPGAASIMVGVELDDDKNNKDLPTTNGSHNDVPLFKCHQGRALFVRPDQCSKDRRFLDLDVAEAADEKATDNASLYDSKMFGQVECPSVAGAVAPFKIFNLDDLEKMCGKFKGIQGHHNSCYLDATLFAMFTFTSVFDSLLFRPPDVEDIENYDDVQKVLREEIVNPLRKNVFVRADRVMKLRQLLDKLSSVSGLTSEEKDPEEFLNSLLAQIMRVEPFLKLSSGQDAFFYQLFVEKDERLSFPSVQQLFEQSFHSSDIKLKEVPSCLIIQMPRFGKNYKMYPRILPSQFLDITDIIEDSPRQCTVCGMLADSECRDCFGMLTAAAGLECTAFCRNCIETAHKHAKRANHSFKKLTVPQDFRIMAEHMTVPRLYMELFAVVCIETSHYVAFVKAGSGPDAPWCFFDSMADRKGEQNGYNIPEMRTVPDITHWLSEDGARTINETSSNDKMLPEHAKRLFCDAYMCMYQSTDVMMYQ